MIGSYIFPGSSGGPPQTHTFPFLLSPYTPNMTLPHRVLNTLMTMGFYAVMQVIKWSSPFSKDNLRNYVPTEVLDVDVRDAARKSLLFMENNMDIMDYPKALYPNHIRVGGLTTRPASPLPQDLENFFSKSKNGVIVVSFGSTLRKSPKQFFERVVNIFKHFKQSVVMSYSENAEYGNVKTMSWLPQNDVLAHKNTVLFVSHCGKNGLNEGFYHAVPIVCMPFHGDQAGNGVKVKYLKIGDSINMLNSKDEDIIQTVQNVLNDKSFKANMNRLSAIYHDAKFTPRETAANALEHVLKFGGDHLRPVSSDFNFLAENMTDVWFIIFMFLCLFIYLFYRLVKCCCCCLCVKQKAVVKNKKE
ncbi:hypothetical protein LOTGIDRAFT_216282 [Lottia gigantea]|uniref:UDP-glucuronosyltransferase n=1 Tax=Lottia gigantea TaxID=225164 RepID=V4A8H8_LOTGI|nr:hypothetical protein LOTGIDRAFT_216282 [Lottia gigantea]ESO93042.1 hypothetical protein LOTGIDRAFT_216282 [Lottia gigantea]